jgi:predicted nucleic acid-binding protein
MSDALVLDASAWVDLLLREAIGERVATRIDRHALHAPAHIDLEMLSAFARIERTGALSSAEVEARLGAAPAVVIARHPLSDLAAGAWSRRSTLRISDAFYVELASRLHVPLITTDRRLARTTPHAEAV